MQETETNVLGFVESELEKASFTIAADPNRVEGLDYLITAPTGKINQLYLRSINLDTQRSIKIQKQDFGDSSISRFLGLVLIIEGKPRAFYLFPSEVLTNVDSAIFIDNDMKMMPHLSNWEMYISTSSIPTLARYEISNFY
jgi:hypothetical protein